VAARLALGAAFAALAVAAAVGAGAAAAVRGALREIARPVALGDVAYVQSATCVRCHPRHHETWRRTFHRTMTQVAGPRSVLGDFDDATYTYRGVTSRFARAGGDYVIETLGLDGRMTRFDVAMTVGSRRVQQYVARVDDRHVRLPLAWDIEAGRWFHLAGGFLHPDGSDFNEHTTLWDANCIFCHNVKAEPRWDRASQRFASRVAELGIACEACHGPGDEHARRNASPLRRYLLYGSPRRDNTIISPDELSKERQVQVCGHCHGQRTPNPLTRIEQLMTTGDPYTAGDDLSRIATPVWADTRHPGTPLESTDFSLRFWRDGTPRLTAYEYQATLQSACYARGEMTCTSCHSMHGGDPRGMITEEKRAGAACLACHDKIARDVPSHTKHKAESTGSDCAACHMPPIVYGLRAIHPTHRIENPDPARAWRHDMPEACTVCHTNRTARWAAVEMARQYEKPAPADLPGAGGDAGGGTTGAGAARVASAGSAEIAETVRALLGGDVLQRAVAANALAAERSYTDDTRALLWAVPFLVVTMEDDYPGIRHFAERGLRALCGRAARADFARGGGALGAAIDEALARLPALDPLADEPERTRVIAAWRAWWAALDKGGIEHPGPDVPLDEALQPIDTIVHDLLVRQENVAIAIGE
jgi:predicted CXXCH cytochrome family protein